jgi:uncharacterized tellurite resistance protein B-like protein
MIEMKNANFKIEKSKWEAFKKISKMKHSDSSKELRKLIDALKQLAKEDKKLAEVLRTFGLL